MGVTGVVVGSLMGLTTKLGSNVLQKVPYMRRTSPDAPLIARTLWIMLDSSFVFSWIYPWEHVLLIGAGAYAGNYFQNKYHQDLKEVEELRLYLERRPGNSAPPASDN